MAKKLRKENRCRSVNCFIDTGPSPHPPGNPSSMDILPEKRGKSFKELIGIRSPDL
jgi:hypothetical protein